MASLCLVRSRWMMLIGVESVAVANVAGSYHSINGRHLPRYLAEFCYRFNRRYKLGDMIPRLGYIAVRTPPMPQRLLSMAEAWG